MCFPQSDIFIVFNLCSKYIICFSRLILFFYLILPYSFVYLLFLALTLQDLSWASFSYMRIVTNKPTNYLHGAESWATNSPAIQDIQILWTQNYLPVARSSCERGGLFLAKVFETDSARIPDLKQQIR